MPHGRDRAGAHRHGVHLLAAIALLLAGGFRASDTPALVSTTSAEAQAAGPGLARFYQQPVNWRACQLVGEQCTEITVPLDYSAPAGRTITIAVDRFPALKSDAVIGALFVNPGGPGGSGIELARSFAFRLPAEIRNRFDLVGFDPRGIRFSTPVDCPDVTRSPPRSGTYPPAPTTAAERLETIWIPQEARRRLCEGH